MQVTLERLPRLLSSQPPSLLLIVGDEPLIAQEACQAWKEAGKVQGFHEKHTWTMEARSSWEDIDVTWRTGSLFDARALLEIRIPGGKPGTAGALMLEKLAHSPQSDKRLLVVLPELDYRTRQSTWFKNLENIAPIVPAQPIPRAQMTPWLSQRLRAKAREAESDALAFLVDCTEGNLLAAHQEIEKLCLVYPQGKLTLDQVQSSVMMVSRHSLNTLLQAIAERQTERACLTLRHLRDEGEALPLLLWSLCEDWRALYRLTRSSANASVVKELRLWGERKNRLMPMCRWVTPQACCQALEQAGKLDRMIKGLELGDPWEELIESIRCFLK